MVERHSRRPYQRASKLAQDETVSEVKGSRFNLIFEEDERAVSTAIMDAAKSIDAHDVCKMPVDSDMVSIAVISTDARDVSMMSIDSSLVSSVALSIVVSPEVARDVGRKSVVVSHSASMIVKPPAKSVVARDREMIIDAPHLVKSQKSLTIRKPIFVQNQSAPSSSKSSTKPTYRASHLSAARFTPFYRCVPIIDASLVASRCKTLWPYLRALTTTVHGP
ncbi:hypothetical protein V6N13_006193 [Hibiscus sabdariffa]